MLKKSINFLKFIVKLFIDSDKLNLDGFVSFKSNSTISNKSKIHGKYHIVNSEIKDYSYISNNSIVSNTIIGKYCSIGPNFYCGRGIHPLNGISTSPMFYSNKFQNGFSYSKEPKINETALINIGNDVFIGANVTILDGITIGDGAVIGAGAVVSKNIPSYAIAVGSPIKVIKYRFKEDVIKRLLETKWWDKSSDDLHMKIENCFFDVENFILYNEDNKTI
jgi:virginiamycin A acetyltransferase